MNSLFFIVVLAPLFVLPVAALILAILAYRRNRVVSDRLDALKQTVQNAWQAQADLGQRVSELEKARRSSAAAGPVAAPPPAAEQPEVLDLDDEDWGGSETPAPPPQVAPQPEGAPPAPPETRGLERQFGTRVAVWLGAVALALAGGFLVKYTVERGLIGPTARVVLGLLFGLSLLGVGEWIARRYRDLARGLDAAGIAVLYSVLLAGFRLYGLYSPTVAFLGMALTTATAVVLSLRHGQLVAVLGMLGGFLTPILIGSDSPGAWTLLVYLLLLEGGLVVVSRRMRWWPLAGLTLVGVMGWGLLWVGDLAGDGGSTMPVALLLVVSMAWFVVSARSVPATESWRAAPVPAALIWGATAPGTVLLAALVGVADFGLMEWAFYGLVGAGCIVLARLDTRYEGLAWIASLTGAGLLWIWGTRFGIARPVDVLYALFGRDLAPHPYVLLWRVALALGAVFTAGAYWGMWRGVRPDRWAALTSVSAIAYFLTAYGTLRDDPFPIAWGLQALLLAGVFMLLALPVARRRATLQEGSTALAAFAVTVTTLVSLAVPMELERAWITVAWALEIVALAWIAGRLRVPHLDSLAWVMGGLVALRLLLNPAVLRYPIGEGILFNWLLYGYGIPIAAFAAGAASFHRNGSEKLARALEIGTILLAFGYLTLEVRQYFHTGDLAVADVMFAEWGAWVVIWMIYGIGLLTLHASTQRRSHLVLGSMVGLLAVAAALLVTGLARNPLWSGDDVGQTTILNRVLWVYGLPAILAVVLARIFRRRDLRAPSWAAGAAALVLGFLTLTLEVRQAFHGAVLRGGATNDGEMYTYSLVWILFAIALLVAGIVTRGTVVRYGSIVVMLVAVGKVFLVDTAQLQDLYRVFSLFGLGVTLMVLAWIYQRFVFREHRS